MFVAFMKVMAMTGAAWGRAVSYESILEGARLMAAATAVSLLVLEGFKPP
jgi:hypothetical protein